MTRRVDLLLEGGTIVDGTGTPGVPGRVAVVGDRIVVPAADEAVEASRVVDVTGHVVAPGFIDLHSHGGLVILAEPRHEPKVRQGVTTELVGVDGNGYAP
ncbi:MAG TPA: N-acyl-D-glutamate deacylase, partial [Candidatus Limnocylindrales bacterium]|nr:N-acyl-D-glutamate deacylase [Candidatus Limnocylindrales bacterium]